MSSPLGEVPANPFLMPVDVDTAEPGVVSRRDEPHIAAPAGCASSRASSTAPAY